MGQTQQHLPGASGSAMQSQNLQSEWGTRKVAIDAIYSITAIIKEEIVPYSGEILNALNNCRFDKIKPVREATLESIKLIKELVAEHPHLQS